MIQSSLLIATNNSLHIAINMDHIGYERPTGGIEWRTA